VLSLLVCRGAEAQGLADLARQAEAQSRATGGKSRRIELGPDWSLRPIPLDRAKIKMFVDLRTELARTWNRDPQIFERLVAAMSNARTVPEIARALDGEPAIARLLKINDYPGEALFLMEASLGLAEEMVKDPGAYDLESAPASVRANYHFAAKHGVWLSAQRARITKAEAGRSLWEPYWQERRGY
jgi:hypothetical protein